MNASTKIATAPPNGLLSDRPSVRQTQMPIASVAAGSTISPAVRGKSNQRARTVSDASGVPRLTSATASATQTRPHLAQAIAFSCSSPLVRSTSQVAPSST